MQQKPDPLVLVAQACFPQLLSLDDLLAARCVCKAWHHSLNTGFCTAWRLPHYLWANPGASPRLADTIAAASRAYTQVQVVLLDSGGSGRPALRPEAWPVLQHAWGPWQQPGTAAGRAQQQQHPHRTQHHTTAPTTTGAAGGRAAGCTTGHAVHVNLHAPPSPGQLAALQVELPALAALRVAHAPQALYSRHMTALASITQLQALELLMHVPKVELRSLAHQRLRRVPLKADCLSSLVQLTRLEISSRGHTGELLPDSVAAFSQPASLAALTALQHLGICEAALPGPQTAVQWLQPLTSLTSLLLVQVDDPALVANRIKAAAAAGGAPGCTQPGAAGAAAGGAGAFAAGGFGAALAAAAQAASAGRTEQHLQAQQLLQTAQGLMPGLASLTNAASNAAASLRLAASSGGGSTSSAVLQPQPSSSSSHGGRLGRTSSAASSADGGDAGHNAAAAAPGDAAAAVTAAAAAAALLPPLPPLDLGTSFPRLRQLAVANLAGDRLAGLVVPPDLTRLVLHLAHPCPGNVTGEQLAAVVLQASSGLVSLELGLGMRFSLSGTVMRGLKRGLKHLRQLTFIEGAQDHLEGLGCWCNLPELTLVEGRCSVPLRGLYELSMRAAMGRTPDVLRYSGHVRHIEELGSRLGAAVHELRLDSMAGLGSSARGSGLQSQRSGSGPVSPEPALMQPGQPALASAMLSPPTARDTATGTDQQQQQEQHGEEAVSPCSGSSSISGAEPHFSSALSQLSSLTRLEIMGDHIGVLDDAATLALSCCKQLRVLHIQGREPWLAPELGVKQQLGWLAELPQLRQCVLLGVMLGRFKLSGGATGREGAAIAALATGTAGRPAGLAAALGGHSLVTSSNKGSAGLPSSKQGPCSGRAPGQASSGSSSSSSSSSSSTGGVPPAVKGLGNGLGCSSRGSSASLAVGKSAAASSSAASNVAAGSNGSAAAATAGGAVATGQNRPMLPATGTGAVEGTCVGGGAVVRDVAAAAAWDASAAVALEELRRWLCELLPSCRVWLD